MTHQSQRPRLLAVSHEASQTGAPTVLATVLEWLREHADVEIHTLLVDDGPLRSRFEDVGTVSAISDVPGARSLGLLERGLVYRGDLRARRLPAAARYGAALAPLGRFDVVYLNSLTTLEALPYLRGTPRVLVHLHEGSSTIGEWRRTQGLLRSRLRPDRWIAVSEDTSAGIVEHLGARAAQVLLHPPFIDVDTVRSRARSTEQVLGLRRSLGIPDDAAVVVGSGSVDRRKGPDLFVQLANEVRRRRPAGERPIRFLWVGGDPLGPDWRLLQAEVERARADHVHITGHVSDPIPYFQLADAFALTSREDPFPLVCLEHAALGVPVVAYDSSGIRLLLERAGEAAASGVIPYLDVTAMADRIETFVASPHVGRKAATALQRAVFEEHDVNVGVPPILQELGLGPRGPSGSIKHPNRLSSGIFRAGAAYSRI
ncbi:MAG: glycosyltransferase family 4 protein [Acidimicrobiales bacterium]|nr:glycosyltransferase family 4 protein [Acidimicrobiales bacterium]